MTPEDYLAFLRLVGVAAGGVVLVLIVGGHVRQKRRDERRAQRQAEWDAMRDRLRKRREGVTYHKSTSEWNHWHGPKGAA